jgi:hypothetical protein
MRISRLLQKLNWKVYFTELFIVILGISIAYRMNIYYESNVNHKLEITAIQNLAKEIEINSDEFESLKEYRQQITKDTRTLRKLLDNKIGIPLDSANKYIFRLVQTSTPDLQQEAANFYLNSNYSNANVHLKNELLSLKTYFQELMELSRGASERKQRDYFGYLLDVVDFSNFEVTDLSAINALRFKNTLWNQSSDEFEINRLYNQSFAKLKDIRLTVDGLLKNSK